ncbi:MAG: hypothetical protein HYU86_01765 [Chloroflexi bacterium]|nr:hypothetical protein [Chloroflexota bacterium]
MKRNPPLPSEGGFRCGYAHPTNLTEEERWTVIQFIHQVQAQSTSR